MRLLKNRKLASKIINDAFNNIDTQRNKFLGVLINKIEMNQKQIKKIFTEDEVKELIKNEKHRFLFAISYSNNINELATNLGISKRSVYRLFIRYNVKNNLDRTPYKTCSKNIR